MTGILTKWHLMAVVLIGGLLACGSSSSVSSSEPSGDEQVTITVFAAASLEKSFTAISHDVEATTPGLTVNLNLAGSQSLVDQLINGARADILATANQSTMDKAVQANLVTAPRTFTTNVLTLVTPAGNPAGITGLDSSMNGKNLVVCAPQVPCGAATVELTALLGVSLAPVSEEQSVTDVMNKVRSGEADAGIVYRTDAISAGDEVEVIEINRANDVVNTYPIALVADSSHSDTAQIFIDAVLSPEGQQRLTQYGFGAQP